MIGLCLGSPAQAWQLIETKDNEGYFHYIEQPGQAGAFFQIVCFEKREQVEIEFPVGDLAAEDATFLVQVDGNTEILLAGFVDEIDGQTSIFVGVDRSSKPTVATQELIGQMRARNELFLGDPDFREAVDVWSLKGFSKAHNALKKKCRI